jgi:membrane protease YdiL (CAAX protease family)
MAVAHLYQGTAGMISIGIHGVIKGYVYLRFGRVWPLIVAHAFYDSVQIAWVVSLIRRGII